MPPARRHCFMFGIPGGEKAIPRYFRALAGRLADRGHRVILVTEPRLESGASAGGLEVRHWPSKRPVHLRDVVFFSALVSQYRPDCVISNFAAANIMMAVAALRGVPCRIDWYHTLSEQIRLDLGRSGTRKVRAGLQRARKRLIYRLATHVVSVTRSAERDLQEVFGVPAAKTHVLHPVIADPLQGREEGLDENRSPFRVVCPGRLDASKGQEEAIRAIALLRQRAPGIEIEFLGDGPCKASYMDLARELGVADRCVFRGLVPLAEVYRAMRSAAVTLVPSRSEAFGLVNIESMAVGTPVVASRTGGVSEIVRHGKDGLLVPPASPEAIAGALATLLGEPSLRQRMCREARRHFLAEFEAGRSLESQGRWLEQALASRQEAGSAECGRLQRTAGGG